MIKFALRLTIPIIAFGCVSHTALADQSTIFHARTHVAYVNAIKADLAWTSEDWTGDDKPYAQARTSIDANCKDETACRNLASTAQTEVNRNPNDPLTVFRWGYASAIVAKFTSSNSVLTDTRWKIFDTLARPVSPHTYNYARLRFILEPFTSTWQQPLFGLYTLGDRLLERDPKDYQVKCTRVYMVIASRAPEDRTLTVKYINELLADYPTRPYPYEAQAMLDYFIWVDAKTPAHARQALDAFNKYLDIAPQNDGWRQTCLLYMRKFQKIVQ